MFTGIIDHQGQIINIENNNQCQTLWIQTQFTDFMLGESIAVDGVCLTVTEFSNQRFACQISPETARLTIAKHYIKNQAVNLERPLTLNSRMGGHFVLGHIDQQLIVKSVEQEQDFLKINFKGVDSTHQAYLTPKGSITINGVSLTINTVFNDECSVMLIPHTLECTNLSRLIPNALVNVEFDYLAKLVVAQLSNVLSA